MIFESLVREALTPPKVNRLEVRVPTHTRKRPYAERKAAMCALLMAEGSKGVGR